MTNGLLQWIECRYTKHRGDGDAFPAEEARDSAATLPLHEYSCAILLGLNVAKAFVQVRLET